MAGKNDIKMSSTHNEGKSKIYKYMASVSKNMYMDKLDDIVNKYNNTYRRTIKIMSIFIKNNMHIDFDKEVNVKDPKSQVGDDLRISKYK